MQSQHVINNHAEIKDMISEGGPIFSPATFNQDLLYWNDNVDINMHNQAIANDSNIEINKMISEGGPIFYR